jgi:hypothetical protein
MSSRAALLGVLLVLILAISLTAVYELNPGTPATSSSSTTTQTSALIASSTASAPSNVSSSSSTTYSTTESANESSSANYTLVWAPNSPFVNPGVCDANGFCVVAMLGFAGQTFTTASATTIIASDGTTIVGSTATTIIRSNGTTYDYPFGSSYAILGTAYIQDAATGQNVTTSTGRPFFANTCYMQPTGISQCDIGGNALPPGHTYKVTVFITKDYPPCSIQSPGYPCDSQLLAPPQTITVME